MATPEQRLVTEAALNTALEEFDVPGPIQDTGWQSFVPSGFTVDPEIPGTFWLRRIEDEVYCRIDGVGVLPGTTSGWLWGNGLPVGYRVGEFGGLFEVSAGANDENQNILNTINRHRVVVTQNDINYAGFLFGADTTVPSAARDDGSRRIYGWLPSWITDDPFPQ